MASISPIVELVESSKQQLKNFQANDWFNDGLCLQQHVPITLCDKVARQIITLSSAQVATALPAELRCRGRLGLPIDSEELSCS